MEFIYPAFFAAAAAISIPIAIHLFNLKKFKKVVFSNVQLLKTIQIQTKSRSQLRHLLILMTRIFFILMLVTSFTMPFLSNNQTDNKSADSQFVTIYLDNSQSMMATNDDQQLFHLAKQNIEALVKSHPLNTRYRLITNAYKGSEQILMGRDQLLDQLSTVEISPHFRTIASVASRQIVLNSSEANQSHKNYLFSDFQHSILDFTEFPNDTNLSFFLIPMESPNQGNLYIDSCWFDSPVRRIDAMEKLFVRIKNNGEEDFEEVPLKLYINGSQKTPSIFNITANSEVVVEMNYVNDEFGIHAGEVVLRDYPVTFDDKFYFNYQLDSTINVLCINGKNENKSINTVFSSSEFNLMNQYENQLNVSAFASANIIILNEIENPTDGLNQELKKYTMTGGNILIIPAENAEDGLYNDLFTELALPHFISVDTATTNVTKINQQSNIYKGVFEDLPKNLNLPSVKYHYRTDRRQFKQFETLLSLRNQEAFLSTYYQGEGKVHLLTSPLSSNHNTFTNHSLFVPTLYNLALFSQPKQNLYNILGSGSPINPVGIDGSQNVFHLTNDALDIIPELQVSNGHYQLYIHDQIEEAGNMKLYAEGNNDTSGVAFNYNRQESVTNCPDEDELQTAISAAGLKNITVIAENNPENLASIVSFSTSGKPLWKYCIVLALLFIIFEMLLIKFRT